MTTITMELEIEIGEGPDDYIYVDLDINATYGNHGIGSYEYWGMRGNDVQMGWEIDDWSYDHSKYTEEENKIINDYLEENYNSISDRFYKMI